MLVPGQLHSTKATTPYLFALEDVELSDGLEAALGTNFKHSKCYLNYNSINLPTSLNYIS